MTRVPETLEQLVVRLSTYLAEEMVHRPLPLDAVDDPEQLRLFERKLAQDILQDVRSVWPLANDCEWLNGHPPLALLAKTTAKVARLKGFDRTTIENFPGKSVGCRCSVTWPARARAWPS